MTNILGVRNPLNLEFNSKFYIAGSVELRPTGRWKIVWKYPEINRFITDSELVLSWSKPELFIEHKDIRKTILGKSIKLVGCLKTTL